MSFPDKEKILKEVVFSLAVSMNANTENSEIKHCPYTKYFKVKNFCETKFRNIAIFWQIRESLELRNIWFGSTCENVQFFSHESFFSRKIFFSLRANYGIHAFISTYLIDIFITLPLEPTTKEVISAELNLQKLDNLLI